LSPKGLLKNLWNSASGGRFPAPAGAEDCSPGRKPWERRPTPRLRHPSPARAGEGTGVREGSPTHGSRRGLSSTAPFGAVESFSKYGVYPTNFSYRTLVLQSTRWLCIALCGLFLFGCRLDMHVQPKYKPLDPSTFFDDGRSARPEVPGTVARGHLRTDEFLYTGKVNGEPADAFPFPVTREVLERGRERYNIYCSPCHDYTGSGRGMVVQRGFPPPPSYHIERLVKAPAGHFFEVMSNGYGAMYSYASRVTPEDRWAIVAYIRALQLSQHATLEDVPPQEREHLTEQAK